MSPITESIQNVIRESGDLILEHFGSRISADRKMDGSFVTSLDREVEKRIRRAIQNEYPDHSILGEEEGIAGNDPDHLWILDPIDGTHNFMRGLPHFAISLGYAHRGVLESGIVFIPSENAWFEGTRGMGARKNGKEIGLAKVSRLEDASLGFDSSFALHPAEMGKLLGDLSSKTFNVRIFGSTAVMLAYLAEGKIDAIVEVSVQPWDYAGGAIIAMEAGAAFCQPDGSPFHLSSTSYLATSPEILESLLGIYEKSGALQILSNGGKP